MQRPEPLRPYQYRAIMQVLEHLEKNPILVLPTGGGKTFTASSLARRLDRPTLWLAHRKELIEQADRALRGLGLNTGIIMNGLDREPISFFDDRPPVWVASVQTLARREIPKVGLVVIDECHHATAEGYGRVLDKCQCPRVGLTATPFRLDGRGLGDVFGQIVVGATVGELVEQGTLHAPRVYCGPAPDLSGVKKTGGDYQTAGLVERMSNLTGDIVETWLTRAAGLRTVCFAVDVEHSLAIVEAFRAAGISAEHLDGTTPATQRSAILKRSRTGETLVVSNCMVLTEGVDIPALQCAILARPTASLNLHLQMIGRIMRRSEGKAGAIVLDHAGNHHTHGLVTRHIEYSLDGKIAGDSDPLGMKRCPGCYLLVDKAEDHCPECGYDFLEGRSARGEREVEHGIHNEGELTEYVEDYTYRANVWNMLVAQAETMRYRPGWAKFQYRERFGDWPVVVQDELVDTDCPTATQKEAIYAELLGKANEKGFKAGWASHQYKRIFGVWPRGFVSDVKRQQVEEKYEAITMTS